MHGTSDNQLQWINKKNCQLTVQRPYVRGQRVCSIYPSKGQIGRSGVQRITGIFGWAAIGFGACPSGHIEAGACRGYRDGLVTRVKVRDTGQWPCSLPVTGHVHSKGAHEAEVRGSHHLRTAASRKGPIARTLGPVRGAGFGTHVVDLTLTVSVARRKSKSCHELHVKTSPGTADDMSYPKPIQPSTLTFLYQENTNAQKLRVFWWQYFAYD